MHIEPGILSSAKIAAANLAATSLLAVQAPQLIKKPQLILRTLLAALFFSVFMQSFHMPAGASELHFIGAMPIYLTLGFVPTLLGFGLGLLLQGVIFEPADLLRRFDTANLNAANAFLNLLADFTRGAGARIIGDQHLALLCRQGA